MTTQRGAIMPIIATILCGGNGQRLWPLSRQQRPKQFLTVIGEETLLQQTVRRVENLASEILLVTGQDHQFLALNQIKGITSLKNTILLEPSPKNTAPSIMIAAAKAIVSDPDAVLLVTPSDHFIPDSDRFSNLMKYALNKLDDNEIICFGVKPKFPATGYGYINIGDDADGILNVAGFVEKPSEEDAKVYMQSGEYLWNTGVFIMYARHILNLAEALEPEMKALVISACKGGQQRENVFTLKEDDWDKIRNISFDFAFMEHAENIKCVSFDAEWSDLGDWNALVEINKQPVESNLLMGKSHQLDSKGTALWNVSDDQELIAIGLENILVVNTSDAILVADRGQVQNVKSAIQLLKESNVKQHVSFDFEERPWGWFKTIASGKKFHTKLLHVFPKGVLSLQSHKHRSEHWVVVHGTATVLLNGEEKTLHSNQSIYICAGDKHQIKNLTDEPLEIIEVQTGNYFGEDDIVRYSDIYGRG